ncbi:RNase III regulator YmdB, partial [gut metagenome]
CYPQKEAAQIALDAIRKTIKGGHYKGNIILCCFLKEDAAIYKELLAFPTWSL